MACFTSINWPKSPNIIICLISTFLYKACYNTHSDVCTALSIITSNIVFYCYISGTNIKSNWDILIFS